MEKRMNKETLVIVIGSLGRGGAERVISYIANYFAECKWNVYILTVLSYKVEYNLNKNIHVVNCAGCCGSRWLRLPYWLYSIRKNIQRISPCVVVSFAARINIITQLSLVGLKIPVVVSERNDPYKDGRGFVVDLFTRIFYKRAKAVVFQTRQAASFFKNYNLKNTYILPNPVKVECYAKKEKKFKIVNVGRLTKQKNQKNLILAFYEVKKIFKNSELWIYGEGELKGDLQSLCKSLDISSSVYFPGNVIDVHKRICDASIFVLSSDYEGQSNALLEAMTMGLPCISTKCAGATEIIENGKNGFLVDVGNVSELINVIKILFNNNTLRDSIRKNAKNDLKKLDSNIINNEWYKIITN